MTDDKVKEMIKKQFGADNIEKIELVRGDVDKSKFVETNYPKPLKRHFFVYESFAAQIEEGYFWVKDAMPEYGFPIIEKIVDTYAASEHSAMFGSVQTRLGAQQDKVASYLGIIGKMVKEMFQIVREIRLLEERESLYISSAKGDEGAERSLKHAWVDFVDVPTAGQKPSSIYQLSTQLGYTVLPDLFFGAPILNKEDVTAYVKKLDYNDKVKDALLNKLMQFTTWKASTSKEISAKKKFTIQYLRQHYSSIKLYIDWVKPYLKNIKRMVMNPDAQLSANLVGAFEGAVIEVEILGKAPGKPEDPKPCLVATFVFRTRPVMVTGQDYSRGPAHIGRMEMTLRAYAWTDEEIEKYKRIRLEEDFELLKSIDESIKNSMELLGEDIKKYLESYGEVFSEKDKLAKALFESGAVSTMEAAKEKAKEMIEKKKKEGPSALEPITALFGGFKELGTSLIPGKNSVKNAKKKQEELKEKRKEAGDKAKRFLGVLYLVYKKAHRLIVP